MSITSLRTKTLLTTAITFFLLTVVLYGFSSTYWFNTLTQIEQNNTLKDLDRIEQTLQRDLENLAAITNDWAAWDDTYSFISDPTESYIQSNLLPSTFSGIGVDIIAFIDNDGRVVYGETYDAKTDTLQPLSPELTHLLTTERSLYQFPAIPGRVMGFLPFQNKMMMVAACPILHSDESGPSRGGVIFTRFISPQFINDLEEQSKIAFQITPLEQIAQSWDNQTLIEQLKAHNAPYAKALNGETFAGYMLLTDIHNDPRWLLQISEARQVFEVGRNGARWLSLFFLLIGLVILLIGLLQLDRAILRRLSKMSQQIQQITSSGDLEQRLHEPVNDELGLLADEINSMLEKIAQSQAEITQTQAELADKASILTEMNQTLESEIEERKEAQDLLQVKSDQQKKLIEAAHQLTTSLNVQEVLTYIARGAREILHADGCVIYLLEEDERTLHPVTAIDEEHLDEVLAADLDIDHSLTGKAVKARHGIIFNHAAQDEGGYQIPGTPVEEEEKVIVAPLIMDDQAVGAILLNRNSDPFTADELQLVETFAAYAATALKNARAHERLQREISERHAAESALAFSESRFQQLVQNIPIGLYRTSRDGKLLFANPALMRMFAFPDDLPLSEIDVRDYFVNPEDMDQERAFVDQDGVVRGYEMQMRRYNGSTFWARDTFQAIFDPNGDLLYFEGSVEDISAKKEADLVQKALYDISQIALTAPDLAALFRRVHQVIGTLMPAENFYFAFYNEKTDRLSFPYFVDQYDPPPPARPLARGLTDFVIRHQKAILVDPFEFEAMVQRGEVEEIGSPSLDWLGVPLINSAGQTFGAMVVQTYNEMIRYTANHLHIFTIISAQVALAIERKTAEDEIQRQRAFLRQVIDTSPNFIFAKDRQGRFTLVNQAVALAYGTTVENLLGKSDSDFARNRREAELFRQDDLEVIQTGREKFIPIEAITDANGKTRWLQTVKRPLVGFSDDVMVLGVSTDITERKLAEDQLSHNAFHDALTGLPNRILFTDRLTHALNRASRRKDNQWFAVLFLDLDHFKTVNDTLGHMLGDQLLIMVAKRLEDSLRAADTIARFGGDEFVFLLEDLDETNDVIQVAERILKDLSAPFNLAGHEVNVSASIGIVLNSSGYEKAEEILRDADIAMYRAKNLGRNRYVIFNSAMRANVVHHLELEKGLRAALENRQFELHYQPITSIKTRQISGFEALLRWRHPEKGLIPPSEFIPFTEETGLILPIGAWVLREGCRQMSEWQQRFPTEPPLAISINLSNKQFSQPDLFEQVEVALQESGLPPQTLQLEITESVIMENAELTIATLNRLVAMGVKIHIDDFGTGYSSLAYLHLLPIDAIKIDRSFISGATVKGNGMEIAQTIVHLAHELHIDAIAEGVETEEQWAKLDNWSCQYAQGYLIAKAMEPHAVENLLCAAITRRDGASKKIK
ncbi:MAG: EAL domain-containing protein [Anaerolineales bacterium]